MNTSDFIELNRQSVMQPDDSLGIDERASNTKTKANDHQTVCFHCLEPVPAYCELTVKFGERDEPMCCLGCKAAATFIVDRGLERFYQHRERLDQKDFFAQVAAHSMEQGPLNDGAEKWQFLDDPETASHHIEIKENGDRCFNINIEGLYCSSCTWLIERALKKLSNGIEFQASIDSRRAYISVSDKNLKLSEVMFTIKSLGYRPSLYEIGNDSISENLRKEKNSAIQRIAVAGFGMMQVMTYAVAGYFGSSAEVANNVDAMQPEIERFLLIVSMLVSTIVVFYSGKPFFSNAISDLRNRRLGMDVPVALAIAGAYFPSVYQVFTHQSAYVYFDSAVMFVFFLSLGRYVEMRAKHRLVGQTNDVNSLLPSKITIKRTQNNQSSLIDIEPNKVLLGDQIRVDRDDILPFDATILEGSGQLDESLMTGESAAVMRNEGERLIAGSQLLSGSLLIESVGDWQSSSIMKIQNSLNAAQVSSELENERNALVGRYFILSILILTMLVGGIWMLIQPERVFDICLAMLIASCPCAFSLAAPIGRSAALHYLRSAGVLLTNDKALNIFSSVSTWCFDKTGTLTKGKPTIEDVKCLSDKPIKECLQILAALEQGSTHSLARAFESVKTSLTVSDIQEITGHGVEAKIAGVTYFAGKRSWVTKVAGKEEGVTDLPPQKGTEILLARSNELIALVHIEDSLRPSSIEFVRKLQQQDNGVHILSGDNKQSVKEASERLNIDTYQAELLPEEKVASIQKMQNENKVVAMVGDGLNDAPVIAVSDVSIAMASGNNLALNNADVVLLNGNLNNLILLQATSKRLTALTRQNLTWALFYNIIALSLAATGFLTPWIAALGMSLSSLLVVFNALRVRSNVRVKGESWK